MDANLIAIVAAALLFVAGYSFYLRLRAGKRRKKYGDRITSITLLKDETSKEEKDKTAAADELFRQLEKERGKGILGYVVHILNEALRPVGGISALRNMLILSLLSGLIGFGITLKVLTLPMMFSVIAGVFLAFMIPFSHIRGKATKRRNQFLDTFPDAIDLIVRAVKAGIPTSESIASAGRELPEPLASEFRRIAQEVAIGVPPDRAMSEAAERVRINDFNFFAVTLMLQRETGGNLAETLENLSALLRKRREMRLKVRAMTSEARFTSKVIGGLPVLVMGALFFLNHDYVMLLFTDPVAQIFLGVAVSLVVIGSIVMNKMVNLEV